jgi:beta-lactamase regulating signal transducer with metallopeptidase domain
MIATWMLYSIVVTGLLGLAGSFGESACLLARRSTRTVWIVVLLGAIAIPMFAVARHDSANAGANGASPPSPISGSQIGAELPATLQLLHTTRSAGFGSRLTTTLAPFDTVLLGAWIFGSVLWLAILLRSATRVRRGVTCCKESVLDGVEVCVSDELGPALAGIITYRIVVPAWVVGLSSEERAFVLEHEREHARAYDPAVIALSAFVTVLMPWNAALWYVQRRLRMAIELDCDTRVLRKLPDVRAYGSLLINVGERNSSRLAPLAAFAEPKSSLKRRIEVMASASPNRPVVRAVLYVVTALVLLITACRAPKPTTAISPADRVRALSLELAALLRRDPSFAANVVPPELYHALDSALTARNERVPVLSAKRNQPAAPSSAASSSRQLDSATHGMRRPSDSLSRLTSNLQVDIDTLRSVANRVEPAAFDSVLEPGSMAVGLVLGAHDRVLRHSSAPIPETGTLSAGYDTIGAPNYTICCGLMKRLFPNDDPPREIRGVTIARVAGKGGGRRVVVIALRTR